MYMCTLVLVIQKKSINLLYLINNYYIVCVGDLFMIISLTVTSVIFSFVISLDCELSIVSSCTTQH